MLRLNYCLFVIFQLYSFSYCLKSVEVLDLRWDIPTKKDLYKYLSAVKNVTDFCYEYKDEVDISLAFGLFVTNVNLGNTIRKQRTLPRNIKNKIKNIINDNNNILNHVAWKKSSIETREGDENRNNIQKRILSFLNNGTNWIDGLERFVYHTERIFTPEELIEIYSPFNLYMTHVENFDKGFPNPIDSDSCLVSLSYNPTKPSVLKCFVDDFCYKMLKRGTNFGYFLTHRILFLQMARLGRGCSVFSEQADRVLRNQFCAMAYAEATYIADNSYALVDLLMEIITICSIDGRSQFLHRTWLDNILKFETSDGCYGGVPAKKISPSGRVFFRTEAGKYNPLREGCSAHTTGLAAATFSSAVRFIIETYY